MYENLGKLCAVILGVIFLYHAYKSYVYGPHINFNKDFINIGYLESENNTTVVIKEVVQTPAKKQDMRLFLDCIDALHVLGMKKTQAKKLAKDIFDNFDPKTVQEFLVIALKNE